MPKVPLLFINGQDYFHQHWSGDAGGLLAKQTWGEYHKQRKWPEQTTTARKLKRNVLRW